MNINEIMAYTREIPVLKVLGLNPNGVTAVNGWTSKKAPGE